MPDSAILGRNAQTGNSLPKRNLRETPRRIPHSRRNRFRVPPCRSRLGILRVSPLTKPRVR